ncbi:MAG: exodeoxyribonuclease V subunit gamma [Anaerolineales bacterium]|nr:exodeoxyribonuclease V subunit gamma [Anaerolineales bacterium]
MPILLTAPAGAGKTATAIDSILRQNGQNTWVLLPTQLQIQTFRDRLLTSAQTPAIFGVQYFTFYELYTHLLDALVIPQHQIELNSVYQVVRRLMRGLELQYLAPIADKAGFLDLVVRLIYELKQARIFPKHFAEAASTSKEHDLALIYSAYQDWVTEQDVVDREGAGWLALEELNKTSLQLADLLVVDGFLQFSPLQAQLLQTLTQHMDETIVTLTYEEARADTVHRAFARTRQRLLELDVTWQERALPPSPNPKRHPTLYHIEQRFWEPSPQQVPAGEQVVLIEAPDAEQEARGVLRRVKHLLLEGQSPEEIIILAHDLNRVEPWLRSVGIAYGVPLVFRRGLELQQNPAIRMVLNLVRLHTPEVDFRRQAVLDVLTSAYFNLPDFDPTTVDILARISHQYQVIRSQNDWWRGLSQAQDPPVDPESDVVPIGTVELTERLKRFFQRVTPPSVGTIYDYVEWIEALLGPDPDLPTEEQPTSDHLGFYDQIRAKEDEVMVRDLYAMQGLRHALKGILAGYELVNEAEAMMTWADFQQELEMHIEQSRAEPIGGEYRSGRVLVTTTYEARGLPHDHVFIMGLAEGVFPAQRSEDPLYRDRERQRLNEVLGRTMLQTSFERQDDVAVFYECIAMARQSLTLSRPSLDDSTNPWPESVLWRAVQALVEEPQVIRYRAGAAPELHEAATLREASIALAGRLRDQVNPDALTQAVFDWLSAHPDFQWQLALMQHGRAIEDRRENPRLPFDRYSGVLGDGSLIETVASMLGPERMWSATQFNDYGYCPFRFFSRRVLGLEALEEPEEGFDAAQLGSVQHAILENTYRRIAQAGLTIEPDNLDRALEVLTDEAERILAMAPARWGFRETALWDYEQGEIRKRLRQLIELDFSTSADSPFIKNPNARKIYPVADTVAGHPRTVAGLEVDFGYPNTPAVSIDGEAGPLRVRGSIDRIDRAGDSLIVVDYKSGSHTPNNEDMALGRNFQMMLYLLAAQQIASEGQVQAGMFWSIQSREGKGEISAADPLVEQARQTLHDYIVASREGYFPIEPTKREGQKCFKYCEFHQFCRIQHTRYETD